ncbi:dihydrofolate reductase [uncultured Methylobacterium sp.]|uniref:dihydrofolate reductase n=1 Tax=uncultured Methylobacterium sp. TaxID=157278 RepID=UPI0035CA9CF2
MKPIERIMPSISYIVARSNPGGVIGCENQLPWRLKTDMKFFRSVTENHVVIMGRKTLESLGRPLPKRVNIVLSSKKGVDTENLLWADSKEMALYLADFISILKESSQIIVIGGAQIYGLFRDLFTKIYLTEVFHNFEKGDAYFAEQFDMREWNSIENRDYKKSEFDEFDFSISILERKIKYTRHRKLEDFFVAESMDQTRERIEEFREKFRRTKQLDERQILLPLLVA